jgi:hypothetical protein
MVYEPGAMAVKVPLARKVFTYPAGPVILIAAVFPRGTPVTWMDRLPVGATT